MQRAPIYLQCMFFFVMIICHSTFLLHRFEVLVRCFSVVLLVAKFDVVKTYHPPGPDFENMIEKTNRWIDTTYITKHMHTC